MTPADFYRMFASIAADMAVDATDPVQRTSLLELAQTWRTLADEQEQPQPGDYTK